MTNTVRIVEMGARDGLQNEKTPVSPAQRHAAALNNGDCFSYALAVARGEPLLFKGADFAMTDVNRAGEASS